MSNKLGKLTPFRGYVDKKEASNQKQSFQEFRGFEYLGLHELVQREKSVPVE